MYYAVPVCVFYTGCGMRDHCPGKARLNPLAASTAQQGIDRLALQPFHHEEELPVMIIEIEDIDDVGMRQALGSKGLTLQRKTSLIGGHN